MMFYDESIEIRKCMIAIGTGGLFIVVGDLLCLPYVVYSSLCRVYTYMATACQIYEFATNTNNSFIVDKKNKADKKNNYLADREKLDFLLFCFGCIMIALGFSCLLLVFASKMFYKWVSSIPDILTIISFILLVVCMIIREYKEHSIKEVSQETEMIMNIAISQLQQEPQKGESKE
jgi:hypothetical protein